MSDEAVNPGLICDLHCDTVLELQGGADLSNNPAGHVDVPRLRAGRVGLQVFACFLPAGLPAARARLEAGRLLDVLAGECGKRPADLGLVTSAVEVDAVARSGRIGVLPAVENGHAIESDLRTLETFRSRGVRYMTLTHARHLPWAASSGEEWTNEHGLTGFGEEVVQEMNRLGIIVDVSHVHERTFWDVTRVARRPFIASHSNAAALCPVPRNLTDDQIRAVAASGGMIGVNFFPGFLDPAYLSVLGASLSDLFRAMERTEVEFVDDPVHRLSVLRTFSASIRARAGEARADIETVVDHLEYIARLVGDDHVGFGSDFDGVPQLPRGVADCAALPHVLDRLGARGFDQRSLRKIAWGNFLRVLRDNDEG